MRCDDGLGALARVSAKDAVHIAGRPRPSPLKRRPSALAQAILQSNIAEELRVIKTECVPLRPHLRRQLGNPFVEARNRHATIFIMQLGDDAREHIDRVRHRAAIHAAVQIARRTMHRDFHVDQPAQSRRNRRRLDVPHARVGHDANIRRQARLRLMHERLEALAARLLFAFDHQRDRAGRTARDRMPRTQRLDDSHDLPLVVNRTAGDHTLAARSINDRGFERRARPQFDRIGGLHVVVTVVKNARPFGGVRPHSRMMRHHHGLSDGFRRLGGESDRAQFSNEPVRASTRLFVERRISAHARNAKKVAKPRGRRRETTLDRGKKRLR